MSRREGGGLFYLFCFYVESFQCLNTKTKDPLEIGI